MEPPLERSETEKLQKQIAALKKSLKESPNDRRIVHLIAEATKKYADLRLEESFTEADESYL